MGGGELAFESKNMRDIKGAGDGLWRKEYDIVARQLVVAQERLEAVDERRHARAAYVGFFEVSVDLGRFER